MLLVTQLEPGGAQRAALALAEGLRARGHAAETWFLYRKRRGVLDERHTRTLLPARPSGPLAVARLWTMLKRELRVAAPNAVVAFTHYANVLGLTAAGLGTRCRRIASHRSPADRQPSCARALDLMLGTAGLYHDIVAVSDDTARSFRSYPRRYRHRLRVVPNGVQPLTCSESRTVTRRAFGLPEDQVLLITVGRLSAPKNQSVLLEALAHSPGIHLAIVGDGELRPRLNATAAALGVAPRVTFTGELRREQVAALYRAADAFALPSHYEGMSNALLEALASGLPVIASDIPSQREVLQRGAQCAGILVPATNVAAWSQALTRVAGDPDLRDSLATAALSRAQEFSMERMIEGFEAVLLNAN